MRASSPGLRKLRPMSIRSKLPFPRSALAALALAAAMIWIGLSPARSQSPNANSALPPSRIARIIEEGGYQLTGPITRHGRVYLANVVGPEDDTLRLVIDAHSGRFLQRTPSAPALRQTAIPEESSPLTNLFDRLFGRRDEVAPLSPPPASDFFETPKPKAQVKRPKSEPAPVVQPAAVPGDNNNVSPANTVSPAPAATAPSVAPPPAADAKPAPAPAPETAAVAPSKSPPPKTASPKVNDVPVAPLE